MFGDDDFFRNPDNVVEPVNNVVDVTPTREPPNTVEEYLRYLYENDGIPMIEKILVLHPFPRRVDQEDPPPKGFFQSVLSFLLGKFQNK